ncbi:MAG: glycosyl transferase family 2 [Polyangiaceae bacterium]|nr:glycosyl transferase family 2 [Polyangiaceae bacterium]
MLSIVVSWRNRLELSEALPGLVASARAAEGDLTVVNFGGDRDLLRAQIGPHAPDVRIVHVAGQRYFNKSCAHNLGVASTRQPILFFCDCDILLDAGVVRDLAARLRERPGAFATLAGVRESKLNSRGGQHVVSFGYELRIRTADGRALRIVDNEEDAGDGTRQAPGLLLVRREDLLRVNGYNARLHGWGWEDQDMIGRLTLGAGLERIMDGHVVHLSHDDHARVAHYPIADRWESRDKMFRQALAAYDRADFSGTYDRDVAEIDVTVEGPAAR